MTTVLPRKSHSLPDRLNKKHNKHQPTKTFSDTSYQLVSNLLDKKIDIASKQSAKDTIVVQTTMREYIRRFIKQLKEHNITVRQHGVKLVGTGASLVVKYEEGIPLDEQKVSRAEDPLDRYIDTHPTQVLTRKRKRSANPGEDEPPVVLPPCFDNLLKQRSNAAPQPDITDYTNDLDFVIELNNHKANINLYTVMICQEQVLSELIEEQTTVSFSLMEVYKIFVRDAVKVDTANAKWSLFSFGSDSFAMDIQVVVANPRSYAFSTDSFELVLTSFFPSLSRKGRRRRKKTFFVKSAFGDYDLAVTHLKTGDLVTNNAEQIYRGVFRYGLELAKGRSCRNSAMRDEVEAKFLEQFKDEFFTKGAADGITVCTQEFIKVLGKFVTKHGKEGGRILVYLMDLFGRRGTEIFGHACTRELTKGVFGVFLAGGIGGGINEEELGALADYFGVDA